MQIKSGLINIPLSKIQYEMYQDETKKGIKFSQREIENYFPVENRMYLDKNEELCLKFNLAFKNQKNEWTRTKPMIAKGEKNIELLGIYYSNNRPIKAVINENQEVIAIQDNGNTIEIMNIYEYGLEETQKTLHQKLLEKGDKQKLKYYESLYETDKPSLNELKKIFKEESVELYNEYLKLTDTEKEIIDEIISQEEGNYLIIDDDFLSEKNIDLKKLEKITLNNSILYKNQDYLYIDTSAIITLKLINDYIDDRSINLELRLEELSDFYIAWHHDTEEIDEMKTLDILSILDVTDLLKENSRVTEYKVLESSNYLFENYKFKDQLDMIFNNKNITNIEEIKNNFEREFINKSFLDSEMIQNIETIKTMEYSQYKKLLNENGKIKDIEKTFVADKKENHFELLKQCSFNIQYGEDYLNKYINSDEIDVINNKLKNAYDIIFEKYELDDELDKFYLTLLEQGDNKFEYEIQINKLSVIYPITSDVKVNDIVTDFNVFIDKSHPSPLRIKNSGNIQKEGMYLEFIESHESRVHIEKWIEIPIVNENLNEFLDDIKKHVVSNDMDKDGGYLKTYIEKRDENGNILDKMRFNLNDKSEYNEYDDLKGYLKHHILLDENKIQNQIEQLQNIGTNFTGKNGFQFDISVDEVLASNNNNSDSMVRYLNKLLKCDTFEFDDKVALCTIVDEFQNKTEDNKKKFNFSELINEEISKGMEKQSFQVDTNALILNDNTKSIIENINKEKKNKILIAEDNKTFSK